jgi:hypothetical protein
MLTFRHLQDALRTLLCDRIDAGELTGMALAEKTGFRQAHISNFLNHKRGLSLEGMDRVLKVEDLSVLDLVEPEEINQRASIPPPNEEDYANLLLVGPAHASRPIVHARDVVEVVKFKQSLLRRMRPDMKGKRSDWVRFLMMKPARTCCEAMSPRLGPGCIVLIDRHYNSLSPYRRNDQTMYAIANGDEAVIRYVSVTDNTLVRRPAVASTPVSLLRVPVDLAPTDLIVGRVAYVLMET